MRAHRIGTKRTHVQQEPVFVLSVFEHRMSRMRNTYQHKYLSLSYNQMYQLYETGNRL